MVASAVAASIDQAGGVLESQTLERDHLNAFYRRMRSGDAPGS